VFSGGISGNQISGTIKAGEFGEFPWNATRIISMPPADPGTAFSEDFNHQSTLSSRRSEFNVLGADEYSGGTIAVIERLMRSIKDECTRRILVPLREDAIRREITFYIDWYNQNRPHQSLGGRIPMDAYFGIDDEITRFETQGEDAVPIQLIVTRFESRRHLPIVELKRAA
jgi:hypothetical protein